MKGIANVRVQDKAEPILGKLLAEAGLDEPPLWKHRPPETHARRARWTELGKVRDGPVNPNRIEITDLEASTEALKKMALGLGATIVGCARLTPLMIADGLELPHEYIFCLVIGAHGLESYVRALASSSGRLRASCTTTLFRWSGGAW